MRSGVVFSGMGGFRGGFTTGDELARDRVAHGRVALAAVAHEKVEQAGKRRIGGVVDNRTPVAARLYEAGLFKVA